MKVEISYDIAAYKAILEMYKDVLQLDRKKLVICLLNIEKRKVYYCGRRMADVDMHWNYYCAGRCIVSLHYTLDINKDFKKMIGERDRKVWERFLKTDSEGNTNPDIFIKITYKERCEYRFSFVDLINDTEKSYILEIPSESEEFVGQPVLVVRTSRTPELWPYKKDGAGYVNVIRSSTGDCLYCQSSLTEFLMKKLQKFCRWWNK